MFVLISILDSGTVHNSCCRFVHPEFLPTAIPEHRDYVKEQLEREDMMKRRARLDVPEFYVG